ncbi:hypothetical protein [uncultured Erythrobacter sp.]|uniref:hypothetical protein n=1 Tax=uncultured Erythrobacter sp. TaxID=263913 RepID=UPI0026088861|nr:hypothetical protein [uncultured Erythrobacter sp.]
MTLGQLIPLILIGFALIELPLFLRWYGSGKMPVSAAYTAAALSITLPIAAYVFLTFVMPELGAQEVL